MIIRVIYNDLLTAKVQDFNIDRLIHENKILGFFRSDGYVRIDDDPLRGTGGNYQGAERRRSASGRN
jgi:hypothetical protein